MGGSWSPERAYKLHPERFSLIHCIAPRCLMFKRINTDWFTQEGTLSLFKNVVSTCKPAVYLVTCGRLILVSLSGNTHRKNGKICVWESEPLNIRLENTKTSLFFELALNDTANSKLAVFVTVLVAEVVLHGPGCSTRKSKFWGSVSVLNHQPFN